MTRRYLAFAVYALLAAAASAGPVYNDRILAVVNEEVITLFDVKSFSLQLQMQLKKQFEFDHDREKFEAATAKLTADATRALIDQEVLYAEFKRRGHTVPADIVDQQVDQMVVAHANGDYQEFLKVLDKQNMTMTAIREQVEKRVAVNMLTETLVSSRVIITPIDVENYYKQNPDAFRKPGRLHLHMIVVAQNTLSDDQFNILLADIRRDIVGGSADLAATAAKYTDNATFTDRGWEGEEDLGTALAALLPARSIGTISNWDIMKPEDGKKTAVLMKVVDAEIAAIPPLTDELRSAIRKRMEFIEKRDRREDLLKRLRANSYIRVHARDLLPDYNRDDVSSPELN